MSDSQPTTQRPVLPTDAELNRMTRIANYAARSGIGGCNTPNEAFAKLLTGWSSGVDAGTALNNIKCVDGRMTLPELVKVAAVRRSGIGDVRTIEVTDDHATVEVTRADWPADRKELVTFGKEQAITAGLMTFDTKGANTSRKDNYRKYAQDMFLARARGTALRRWLEEASSGLPYSPDELGAETDEDGNVVELEQCGSAFGPSPGPLPAPSLDAPAPSPSPAQPATPALGPQPGAVDSYQPTPAPSTATQIQAAAPDPVANALNDIERKTLLEERTSKAKNLLKVIGWDGPTWKQFLSHHWGKSKLDELNDAEANDAVCQLVRLQKLVELRKECTITDAQWVVAKQKRGVQHDWQLTGQQAQELVNKLADNLSPFRRQELGIDAVPTGSVGGNESKPAAGVLAPSAQPVGTPATPVLAPSLIPSQPGQP